MKEAGRIELLLQVLTVLIVVVLTFNIYREISLNNAIKDWNKKLSAPSYQPVPYDVDYEPEELKAIQAYRYLEEKSKWKFENTTENINALK